MKQFIIQILLIISLIMCFLPILLSFLDKLDFDKAIKITIISFITFVIIFLIAGINGYTVFK